MPISWILKNSEAAALESGIDYEGEKITDVNDIIKYGVMMTLALAVDDEVKLSGKVADPAEIKKLLSP